ncbi:MAG TPA: DUF2905 domain-containing protein [Chloroflexi bacterium]|nr:DUF2905 domain-containing protein [Chloroflexota bacterium]
MSGFEAMGKMLVFMGLLVVVMGLLLIFIPKLKVPFLGKLPGDIIIQRERFSFYFPIVTCIVISILLTIVLNVVIRLLGR